MFISKRKLRNLEDNIVDLHSKLSKLEQKLFDQNVELRAAAELLGLKWKPSEPAGWTKR